MIPRRALPGLLAACFTAGAQEPPATEEHEPNNPARTRLPNGKLQSDAIAKADYESGLDDAHKLAKLAEDLSAEMEKNDRFVVSVSVIKKTEEIEKLAKRIRTRLKRY